MSIGRYEWPVREGDLETLVTLTFEFKGAGERPDYVMSPSMPFYLQASRELRIRLSGERLVVEFV